jgi:hypothetical protein
MVLDNQPIVTTEEQELAVEPMAYECKFTVESRGGVGGDFQRNVGGMQGEKRVTFSGQASPVLYAALIDAMAKVVES